MSVFISSDPVMSGNSTHEKNRWDLSFEHVFYDQTIFLSSVAALNIWCSVQTTEVKNDTSKIEWEKT